MGRQLNPDGAKIKILRIRRGWTQEQLAEIAGVSTRTVQRAETANCASFDTIRAIAGAFETDFDQLLKQESYCAPESEPQVTAALDVMGSEPEMEPILVENPKPPVRRVWAAPLLSVATLAIGLVTGIILTIHLNTHGKFHSPGAPTYAVVARPVQTLQNDAAQVTVAPLERRAVKAKSLLTKTAPPRPTAMITRNLPHRSPPEQSFEIWVTANPGSADIVQGPPAPLELPQHSHTLFSELVIPAAQVASSDPPVLSGGRNPDAPGPGTVRRAVDLAARRTGMFVSKAGSSIKRAF